MNTRYIVPTILLFSANPNKTNFRLQLYRDAKRHLQVITIARRAYFLIGGTHASFLGHVGRGQ